MSTLICFTLTNTAFELLPWFLAIKLGQVLDDVPTQMYPPPQAPHRETGVFSLRGAVVGLDPTFFWGPVSLGHPSAGAEKKLQRWPAHGLACGSV